MGKFKDIDENNQYRAGLEELRLAAEAASASAPPPSLEPRPSWALPAGMEVHARPFEPGETAAALRRCAAAIDAQGRAHESPGLRDLAHRHDDYADSLVSIHVNTVEGSAKAEAAVAEHTAPEFSEAHLAAVFAQKHAESLRYVAIWDQWYRWTGSVWLREESLLALHLAKEICAAAAKKLERVEGEGSNKSSRAGRSIARAAVIQGVTSRARADRTIAATKDQWDMDPWFLNTPAGIVDLRTGAFTSSNRAAYCTKSTTVAPDAFADCPAFVKFLHQITKGDSDYIAYLQRLFGYCLTGDITEQMMAFAHGPGGGGKSTLFNAIGGVMGDYRVTAPMEIFVQTAHEAHSTDKAFLMGARMVTASETEQGRRWAEAKIKTMTGGDPITARFMRQNNFTYTPQFKLVIFGNHRPSLRSVDEAIRRRFHLLPFPVSIPKEKQDPNLPARLVSEGPGILRWAIDGCLAWRRLRLKPPAAVINATNDYLSSEDNIQNWLDEECTIGDSEPETTALVYASWKRWAEAAGAMVGTEKDLVQAILGKLGDRASQVRRRFAAGEKASRGLHGLSVKSH